MSGVPRINSDFDLTNKYTFYAHFHLHIHFFTLMFVLREPLPYEMKHSCRRRTRGGKPTVFVSPISDSPIVLSRLQHPFGLWMVGDGLLVLDPEQLCEARPKGGGELAALI